MVDLSAAKLISWLEENVSDNSALICEWAYIWAGSYTTFYVMKNDNVQLNFSMRFCLERNNECQDLFCYCFKCFGNFASNIRRI